MASFHISVKFFNEIFKSELGIHFLAYHDFPGRVRIIRFISSSGNVFFKLFDGSAEMNAFFCRVWTQIVNVSHAFIDHFVDLFINFINCYSVWSCICSGRSLYCGIYRAEISYLMLGLIRYCCIPAKICVKNCFSAFACRSLYAEEGNHRSAYSYRRGSKYIIFTWNKLTSYQNNGKCRKYTSNNSNNIPIFGRCRHGWSTLLIDEVGK